MKTNEAFLVTYQIKDQGEYTQIVYADKLDEWFTRTIVTYGHVVTRVERSAYTLKA